MTGEVQLLVDIEVLISKDLCPSSRASSLGDTEGIFVITSRVRACGIKGREARVSVSVSSIEAVEGGGWECILSVYNARTFGEGESDDDQSTETEIKLINKLILVT